MQKRKDVKEEVYGCGAETINGKGGKSADKEFPLIRFRRNGFMIGSFCIIDMNAKSVWIENIIGKGIQTSKAKFEAWIKKYYDKEVDGG